MTLDTRPTRSSSHPPVGVRPTVRSGPMIPLLLAAFAALAVLVGRDGSWGWQLVRVLAVAALAWAAATAVGRLRDRGRGWLTLAVGVLVAAIGAGFLPFLAKQPVSVPAVGGLVALVTGLLLIAAGTVARTRVRRMPRRLLAGAGAAVAVVLVAYVVGPAVAATNVPRPEIGATPESIGLSYEEVTVSTADGVDLAGWYVPSTNRAAVVVLHGAGSTRSDVLAEAAVLARHGFGVLLIDARGHGDSGGRAMDFGWHGDADIAAATAFLATRDDVDPGRIGVVGSSMGGEQAIGASASNDQIRAVVAEGATARTAADEAWLSEDYGVRGVISEQLERVQDWVTDVLTSADVPVALRAAVAGSGETRYLLITAGDVDREARAATHIASAAPDRVLSWDVEGAAHTDGLGVAPDEWESRVVAFLSAALDVSA